jgi:hypothetical protein
MSYVDIVICIGSLPILETWPPIYRGQERTVEDRLKVSQSSPYVYFQHAPCLTDFTFEFIRRPTPPILSPLSRTFVELTLVTWVRTREYVCFTFSYMEYSEWLYLEQSKIYFFYADNFYGYSLEYLYGHHRNKRYFMFSPLFRWLIHVLILCDPWCNHL